MSPVWGGQGSSQRAVSTPLPPPELKIRPHLSSNHLEGRGRRPLQGKGNADARGKAGGSLGLGGEGFKDSLLSVSICAQANVVQHSASPIARDGLDGDGDQRGFSSNLAKAVATARHGGAQRHTI